jgi:hypothetical protein
MGKPCEEFGDSLDEFDPYLSPEIIVRCFQDPLSGLQHLLSNATTRHIYDYHAINRRGSPAASSSLAREIYVFDIEPGEKSRIMLELSYFDGSQGRIIQKKTFVDCDSVE